MSFITEIKTITTDIVAGIIPKIIAGLSPNLILSRRFTGVVNLYDDVSGHGRRLTVVFLVVEDRELFVVVGIRVSGRGKPSRIFFVVRSIRFE
jgi:hypothetical protein